MILPVCLLLLIPQTGAGKSQVDVSRYIETIESGGAEQVREEIPSLLERYPNDPGVLYVQAIVTVDGAEAVRLYQGIVDTFPQNEWADDSLYKVYQFYYAIGLYRTAGMKMDQLRKTYPRSQYAQGDVVVQTATLPDDSSSDGVPVDDAPRNDGVEVSRASVPEGQFALQVGAYSSQENAEKQKLFFEDLGYPVEVINRLKGDRSLFLVLIGNYLTYEQAKSKEADIRRKYNISSFVVSR